jgi:hypothetical protein
LADEKMVSASRVWKRGAELSGDLAPLRFGRRGGVLCEGGGDESGNRPASENQAALMHHRAREMLVAQRAQLINALRGHRFRRKFSIWTRPA